MIAEPKLIPCPLAELPPGWLWVEHTHPPVACSRCGATGLRSGFKRAAGVDAGKYFCVVCGPEGIRDRVIQQMTLATLGDQIGFRPRSKRRKRH